MLKTLYQRCTLYLAPQDKQAIKTIKDMYGLSTDSDAVRVAVRLVAESPVAQIVKPKRAYTRRSA